MKNSKVLFHELISAIHVDEDQEEVRAIAYVIMEKLFGLTRADIMAEKNAVPLGNSHAIEEIVRRLNAFEPIQYILGEAPFYGRRFRVTPDVLIPRPETEELVRHVIHSVDQSGSGLSILDIGTGSGCIAITLALELPMARVAATDVSPAALEVAAHNAQSLQANVAFSRHDILRDELSVRVFDAVVSNPPYIANQEKETMRASVYGFEPALALFVEDDDPLVFYQRIISQSCNALKPGGLLAFEINERFGKEVAGLLVAERFGDVHIIRDVSGKERIVSGVK